MKSNHLIAVTLFTFALIHSTPASASGPAITFESTVKELGEIDQGDTLDLEFVFSNSGTEALVIEEITTTCGCTTAEMDKTIYEPGESGTISVRFDSQRFVGPVSKLIAVDTNITGSARTQLTIHGTVVVEVLADPGTVFFSKVSKKEGATKEVRISTEVLERLELSNLRTEPAFLSAEIARVDAQNAVVTIKADGASFPEDRTRLTATVLIDTNSTRQATIRIPVTIAVLQEYRVMPRSVYFFASSPGKERQVRLKILAADRSTVEIAEIRSDLEYISAQATEDGGVLVTFNGDPTAGKFTGSLTIRTTSGSAITIPVRGTVNQ